MTDLLRVGRSQGQAARGKHVLFAIVHRLRCEDICIRSLQVLNQLHVDSGRQVVRLNCWMDNRLGHVYLNFVVRTN